MFAIFLGCPEPPAPSEQKSVSFQGNAQYQSPNQTPQDSRNQFQEPPNNNDGSMENRPISEGNNQGFNENINEDNSHDETHQQIEDEKTRLNPDMKGGYPEITGEIISQSILIKINESGQENSNVLFTQDQLVNKKTVSLQGRILCEGDACDDTMVMRILPFQELDLGEEMEPSEEDGKITSKQLFKTGEYSILVPKSDKAVVIELLVDSDNNGVPSPGERMAVLEQGGKIIPNKNIVKLDLDVSDRDIEGPMGGPLSPDEPPPPEQE